MNDSPQGGGAATVASLVTVALVVLAMWAMISASGGPDRPLLSSGASVSTGPGHARQG